MAGRVVAVVLGAAVLISVLGSAIRTVILPRAVTSKLLRAIARSLRVLFRARSGRSASFERRDAIMAMFAPIVLITLLAAWVLAILGGYTAIFWGIDHHTLRTAFLVSGSSAFTLGTQGLPDVPSNALSYSEAGMTLLILALLISFLPTLYQAFSRREVAVSSLETRAGSPPSASVFIDRIGRIRGLHELTDLWERWEWWFVELQETHTSYQILAFFRSPLPDHSWVTAAGAMLDSAALVEAAVDIPPDPAAQLCLRAGWLSLRRIATSFGIPFEPDPRQDDAISIRRDEFDEVLDRLAGTVALKADRDQAWRDFAGWRVNYDTVVLDLAALVMAPPAAWTSDRPGKWRPWWLGRYPLHGHPA